MRELQSLVGDGGEQRERAPGAFAQRDARRLKFEERDLGQRVAGGRANYAVRRRIDRQIGKLARDFLRKALGEVTADVVIQQQTLSQLAF